jgi:hypothetical protein
MAGQSDRVMIGEQITIDAIGCKLCSTMFAPISERLTPEDLINALRQQLSEPGS